MCDCNCCPDPFSSAPPVVSSVTHEGGEISAAYDTACSEPAGAIDGDLLVASVSIYGDLTATGDLSPDGFSLLSRIANTWVAKPCVNEVWTKTRSGAGGPYSPTITGVGYSWALSIDAFRNWGAIDFEASQSDQLGTNPNPFPPIAFPEGGICYGSLTAWNGFEDYSGTLEPSTALAPFGDASSWQTSNMLDNSGTILVVPDGDPLDAYAGHILVISPA